jgi:long-chain fatty acid transport protein
MSSPHTPFAMGMAIVGAGLGTNYPQSDGSFFDPAGGNVAYSRVGVNLVQMQILPSLAFRLNDTHSIGATFVIGMQVFRAFGLETFQDVGFTASNEALTNNNNDWSFGGGLRFGWLGKFLEDDRLMLGVNYSTTVWMQRFNQYQGLFAQQGEFNIPENYAVGLSYKLTKKFNVAFDVQRILWSDVPSIGNPGPNALDPNNFFPPGFGLLGQDNGMGFGWEDQTVYKLGVDYQYRKNLTVRTGVNYGETPIPENQVLFNLLAPATVELHLTFGATYELKNKSELSFNLMRAFENTIKGQTAFGPIAGVVPVPSNASLAMSQTSIGIGYGLKF